MTGATAVLRTGKKMGAARSRLRRRLQLAMDELLDPYELAPLVGLFLMDAREVCECLDRQISRHILLNGKDDWSGGVLAAALPDGSRICILIRITKTPQHLETIKQNILA